MENATYYAMTVLKGDGITGTVKFMQTAGQQVQIKVNIKGLTVGKHGFHVHEYGNLTGGCATAGAHYNPAGVDHAGPVDSVRHVGDLGNVPVTDATVETEYSIVDRLVNIFGDLNNVVGRSVVIHQDEDDLGLGGQSDSKTTGHAGARVCCGVIGQSGPFDF